MKISKGISALRGLREDDFGGLVIGCLGCLEDLDLVVPTKMKFGILSTMHITMTEIIVGCSYSAPNKGMKT